ncbi:YqgE/AlgH family protein [Bacteroidota bacterium]
MDLDFDFFQIGEENLEPQKGCLLISEPFLQDSYFKRSVILLTEYNEEGAVGFVLNKPSKITINEVIEDFPEVDNELTIGGPVATNTVHFCHSYGDLIPNSVHVINNLFWGGDFDVVKKLFESNIIDKNQIRFFIGYSGWAPDQLKAEFNENSWIVTDIGSLDVLQVYDKQSWKKILSNLGNKYKIWSNYPENPVMN